MQNSSQQEHFSELFWKEYDDIENKTPKPIVDAFRKLRKIGVTDYGAEKILLDIYEVITKLISSIIIASYENDEIRNKQLDENISKLVHPSIGMYVQIIRTSIKHYNTIGNEEQSVPAVIENIISLYSVNSLDERSLLSLSVLANTLNISLKKKQNKISNLLDILTTYRNKSAHGSQKDESSYSSLITHLALLVLELTKKFTDIVKIKFLFIEEKRQTKTGQKYTVFDLIGDQPRKRNIESEVELNPDSIYATYQEEQKENFKNLSPLVVWRECKDTNCHNETRFFFLNGIKKKSLEYLSYKCSHTKKVSNTTEDYSLAVDSKIFRSFFSKTGIREFEQKFPVTDHSKLLLRKAQAEYRDGYHKIAIEKLLIAIDESPLFIAAFDFLVKCYLDDSDITKALKVTEQYLQFKEDYLSISLEDMFFLDKQRKLLESIDKYDESEEVYEKMKIMLLNNKLISPDSTIIEIDDVINKYRKRNVSEKKSWNPLPYHQIQNHILTKNKDKINIIYKTDDKEIKLPFVYVTFILLCTLAISLLFWFSDDMLMAITALSFGGLWIAITTSNIQIYKLIVRSYHNFNAFLNIQDFDNFFNELLIEIFCKFTWKSKQTRKRVMSMLVIASLISYLIFSSTIFRVVDGTAYSPLLNVFYFILLLFVNIDLMYLIQNLINYNRVLKKMKKKNIIFTLSQHPKYSVKYFSFLSRKISYPLIYIYLILCFILFLGPIKSNIVFIGIFIIFLCFILYVNISAYRLIRNVVVENKWKLISKFSTHFDLPFDKFIKKATSESFNRIKELILMRKFIESINVVGEKKIVIFLRLLSFIFIIIFGISFFSNTMTKKVIPAMSSLEKSLEMKQLISVVEDSISIYSQNPMIKLSAGNVDDTVILVNFTNYNQLDTLFIENDYCESARSFKNEISIIINPIDKPKFELLYNEFYQGIRIRKIDRFELFNIFKRKLINEFNFELFNKEAIALLGKLNDDLSKPEYCINPYAKHLIFRIDWTKGDSPKINESILMESDSLFIFSLAYNKVYYPPSILLGGGKLSYYIEIEVDDNKILNTSRFIRTNKKELGFVSFIKLEKSRSKDKVWITKINGINNLQKIPEVKELINKIEIMLSGEKDAKI